MFTSNKVCFSKDSFKRHLKIYVSSLVISFTYPEANGWHCIPPLSNVFCMFGHMWDMFGHMWDMFGHVWDISVFFKDNLIGVDCIYMFWFLQQRSILDYDGGVADTFGMTLDLQLLSPRFNTISRQGPRKKAWLLSQITWTHSNLAKTIHNLAVGNGRKPEKKTNQIWAMSLSLFLGIIISADSLSQCSTIGSIQELEHFQSFCLLKFLSYLKL